MDSAKRRAAILKLLACRRYETVGNLARELCVSERTVRRDIEALSLTEPIYTQSGRHYGGVYLMDGYRPSRTYEKLEKAALLSAIYKQLAEEGRLTADELSLLSDILEDYAPLSKKEKTTLKFKGEKTK